MMKLSRAKGLALPAIKNEYRESRRYTVIGRHYTSLFFQCATSENRIANLVSKHLLSHQLTLGMKPPASYTSELLHSHPNLCNQNYSKTGHIFKQVRHFSSISKIDISEDGKAPQFPLSNNMYVNNKSLHYKRNTSVSHNCRRTFLRPSLDSRQLGSVSLLDIKKFLRQKLVDFKETHACLCLRYTN